MQITKQADYAVRAILHLARNRGARTATGMIAAEQHIPPSFLAKIVAQLSVVGLLNTSRGAQGGVSLARDPKDITLLEVIEAIDGPIRLNDCVGEDHASCFLAETCPLRSVWSEAQERLVAHLKQVNFADMALKGA